MNSFFTKTLLHYSIAPALLAVADEFHDIAPPVDYSLIPPWLVFVIAFVVLSLLGLVVWWFVKRRKPQLPPKAPREIALGELEQIRPEIDRMSPYEFSIRVSDILRRYVTQQYGVPATRQTSIEFLTAAAKAPSFSADDKSLLEEPSFTKTELAGRPLSGVYRLRLRESPSFVFDKVDDIQLKLRYRYWSNVSPTSN